MGRFVLLCLLTLSSAARADTGTSPPRRALVIAPLANEKTGDGSCGCLLESRGRPIVFIDASADQRARLNLGRGDVDAKRVGPEPDLPSKRGSRYHDTWRAGATTIRIDYRVTATCGDGLVSEGEGCEGMEVDVTITASDGKSKTSVKAAGYCGC